MSPSRYLFTSQRGHWVDFGCSAGGHGAGDGGYCAEEGRYCEQGQGARELPSAHLAGTLLRARVSSTPARWREAVLDEHIGLDAPA
jgi:hypothetical protein